jgi:BlaI family transcriptional regulator, penicillinase repressor
VTIIEHRSEPLVPKPPQKPIHQPKDDSPAGRPSITAAEWDILGALWHLKHATARDVAEELAPERQWAYSTVKTMLDRMVDKRLVAARQVGNVWEYTPGVQPSEARLSAWRRFVSSVFGGAMDPALRFIAEEASLTPAQREALLAALTKQEKTRE